jgi:hypothetical protein
MAPAACAALSAPAKCPLRVSIACLTVQRTRLYAVALLEVLHPARGGERLMHIELDSKRLCLLAQPLGDCHVVALVLAEPDEERP